MNFTEMSYHDFYMDRTSWTAQQKSPIFFTKEEVQWAVKQTDYKYFGDYEFSDQQKMAVDILVWVAQEKIREYEEKA